MDEDLFGPEFARVKSKHVRIVASKNGEIEKLKGDNRQLRSDLSVAQRDFRREREQRQAFEKQLLKIYGCIPDWEAQIREHEEVVAARLRRVGFMRVYTRSAA